MKAYKESKHQDSSQSLHVFMTYDERGGKDVWEEKNSHQVRCGRYSHSEENGHCCLCHARRLK